MQTFGRDSDDKVGTHSRLAGHVAQLEPTHGTAEIAHRQGRLEQLDHKPLLVFWETTKACPLSCKHCRATAIDTALPDELSHIESLDLLNQIAEFGKPAPILVMTGGDLMVRTDTFSLIRYARDLGIRVAISPAVSPLLNETNAKRMFEYGVRSVSISVDGIGATHDGVRGKQGHYESTLATIAMLTGIGYTVQVNSTVMRTTVNDLPKLAATLIGLGVQVWEVFFLIQVGRGTDLLELLAEENEDVARFLYDVSQYGMLVRTVEAPLFRRVATNLRNSTGEVTDVLPAGSLYRQLSNQLLALMGQPTHKPKAPAVATRDGKGIVFISQSGEIFPSGFLPLSLGNVKTDSLVDVYRNDPLLKQIREADFQGRCGICEYRDLCGGSRSRAFTEYANPLAEDPACAFVPSSSSAHAPHN